MSLSPDAIAAAVKAEIERQQRTVVYDELSTEELQRVVEQLTAKLNMCTSALVSRTGGGTTKADEPKGKTAGERWKMLALHTKYAKLAVQLCLPGDRDRRQKHDRYEQPRRLATGTY